MYQRKPDSTKEVSSRKNTSIYFSKETDVAHQSEKVVRLFPKPFNKIQLCKRIKEGCNASKL